ncbi:lipase family protein [Nocardia sp. NBC_00565]|uniref:lipase family protein n=1 Tax=Nocardia sp. NBC_00565 TaxID=2975993 RepID=UPI002E8047C1|nr:lipase family protein [Nocardia sp. NBC_00565]WUC07879.1 lipase family protein [Nocardia sp. NBC_00565]
MLLATTATAQPLYPQPDPDPFYAAPADLGAHRSGDVLDVRGMPPLPLFPGAAVTLVKFRSTDSHGAPIAATTTILTPAGHQPDGPLLSYQHFINALGTGCAVSHTLYNSDLNLTATAPLLNAVLAQGWSVALPDHLGPQMALGAARLGGHIVLDGIRAVKRLPELAVQHSPAVMAGYSGGGLATAWAATLQPSYAPELQLAGAAIGGIPANLVAMALALGLDPHPAFGLAMATAMGLEREYPDRVPISSYLNLRGFAVRDAIANSCTNGILAIGANSSARDYLTSTSIFDSPAARSVVEENSLELYAGVPDIPMFEWHSPSDPLIPVDAINNTDRRWCEAGVQLQTMQVSAPEHLSAAAEGAPAVLWWLDGRVRGEPAPITC